MRWFLIQIMQKFCGRAHMVLSAFWTTQSGVSSNPPPPVQLPNFAASCRIAEFGSCAACSEIRQLRSLQRESFDATKNDFNF